MQYKDFVIHIAALEGGSYSAQATYSEKERTAAQPFHMPECLQLAQGAPASDGGNRSTREVEVKNRKPRSDDRKVGRKLYDALFQGEIGKRFQQFRPLSENMVLRVELVLDSGPRAAILHNLPWELLYDGNFLARDFRFSIVHWITDGDRAARSYGAEKPPFAYDRKLRVLAVASDPMNLSKLNLADELESLEKQRLHVVKLDDVSRQGLQAQLEEGFHILHFMGHGDFVEGKPVLFFKDSSGRSREVGGSELADDLRVLSPKLWPNLIVLNACHGSAVAGNQDALQGVAFELIRAGVLAVVAMRREIPDKAAIHFSQEFYRHLAKGGTVDEAVVRGRNAIDQLTDEEGRRSWSVPVLYSRLPGGRLFRKPFPWKSLVATLTSMILLLASYLIREALRDIRVSFDQVEITGGTENDALWRDTSALQMGLAVTRGIAPTDGEGDFRVALRLEDGEPPRLVGAIFDRKGTALPELIYQADEPLSPEKIMVLKRKLLFGLLGRFGLDKASRGRIERLQPVEGRSFLLNSQGVEHLADGDLEDAEASFAAAIKADGHYAVAHANLAMLLFHQARYEEALPHAQCAVNLVEEFQVFHYNLGRVHLALGDTDAAAAAFRRALDRDSGYVAARHELAKILISKQDWPAARRALARCGDFPPAIKNLGRVDLETGAVERAIIQLERALTLLPPESSLQQAETHYLLARAYRDNEQTDLACSERAAYYAIPYADRLTWARELGTFDCEALVVQRKPGSGAATRRGPFAFAVMAEGSSYQRSVSGQHGPVAAHDALARGQTLTVDEDGMVTLVCSSGNQVLLKGPGSWTVNEDLCGIGESGAEELYAMLLDRMDWEMLSLGRTTTVASRGEDGDFLVDPVASTADPRPDLVWTDTAAIASWQLTLREHPRPRTRTARIDDPKHERLPLGKVTVAVCRVPWPKEWPPLSEGGRYLIAIEPAISAGPDQQIRIDARLQLMENRGLLDQRLARIDERETDAVSRLELHAAAQRAAGDLSGTIATCLQLYNTRGSDQDILALAQAYLNAGVVPLAVPWFDHLLEGDVEISTRAAAEAGLGQAHLARNRDEQALTHLARARALYGALDRQMEIALIDEAMNLARANLTALGLD